MVRVIATDLDGTLLKPAKKISLIEKENKKFIKQFYGDIVLNTGRTPKFCAKICNSLKIEHNFIALNGAVIVKNGAVIYRQSMKKSILNNMLDFLVENYDNFEFLIFDKYDKISCFTTYKSFKTRKKFIKLRFKKMRLCERKFTSNKRVRKYLNDNTEIYKALIYFSKPEDMANLLKDKYGEHFEFFATEYSIEISPIGTSKGSALKYLIDTTELSIDDVYVVGDSTNDISMFEMFPNSFLVGDKNHPLTMKVKHTINKFSDLQKYTRLNKNFHRSKDNARD